MERVRQMILQIKRLFSLVEFVCVLGVFILINFIFQLTISKNMILSIIFGLIGGWACFHAIAVLNRQTRRYQLQLKALNHYASGTVFKLKSNLNVPDALKAIASNIHPSIQKDVQKLIMDIDKNQTISANHFLKYDFAAIDIFHQILEIRYEFGGKAADLFHQILQDIAFEIKERDKLYRKKKIASIQVFMMIAMVASIPVLLRFMAKEVYQVFLSLQISIPILITFHIVLLFNIHFLQKATIDISINN